MQKTVFLSAPLSTLAEQNLNAAITEIIRETGLTCFAPQENLPPGRGIAATAIFQQNVDAVTDCDIVLVLLDKPGSGVIFELAYGFALKKTIIAFRSDQQDYLGKIIEGFWELTPSDCKARTLDELRQIFSRLAAIEEPESIEMVFA
jgi:nucleoside 2-deoxyribosyltransferase